MALDTSLNGVRNRLITSIFGRRLGLETNNALAGMVGVIEPISGFTSGGTTLTSTSVATNLPAYGLSVIGASGASGTTAYLLDAPIPGVRKTLFVPTTGYAVVLASTGAFYCTSASVTSTYQIATFTGKGNVIDMIGITTALWGVLTNYAITTVTTGNTVSFV